MITKSFRYYHPETLRVSKAYVFYGSRAPREWDTMTEVSPSEAETWPLFTRLKSHWEQQWEIPERLDFGTWTSLVSNGAFMVRGPSGNITSKQFDEDVIKTHQREHPNFELRKSLGEVIVSDYSHSKATVRYSDGIKVISRYKESDMSIWITETGSRSHCRDYARTLGYSKFGGSWSAPASHQTVMVAPNVWVSLLIRGETHVLTFEEGHHALDYGFNYGTIKSLITCNENYAIKDQIPIDGAIVTSVAAKANQGDADILTLLAEAPMTIATALAGIAKVGEMSKDLRTLDIKKSRISRSVLQKWRRAHWDHLKKRVPKKRTPRQLFERYEAAATSLAGELLDATAIVNLWWRYDLRPNLYSLDDHIQHMENMIMDNGRRRYRDKVTIPFDMPTMPGFTWEGEAYYEDRYTCIRHYYTSDWLSKVKRSLTTDKVVTLWELLWGSFMVDWLINVGDVLGAMPVRDPLLKCDEGFTVSRCTVVRGVYTMDSNPSVKASVTINGYKRAVILPEEYIGFYYRNKLDLWKIFDAALIAWGLSRPKLRKTPIFTFL